MHRITDDALWSFETAQFFVGFYAEPEDMDPADSFEFEEDNGAVAWVPVAVRVYFKDGSDAPSGWREVGSDYLGAYAYESVSVRDFYTSHRGQRGGDYFSDMVAEAIGPARTNVSKFYMRD